jgi:ATP-dependent DNA ligase
MNTPAIHRPPYESVALETGLRWGVSPEIQFTEKMDGRRHELAIGQSIIVGELMRDERFYAFDLPIYNGADIRLRPRRERLAILAGFNLLRPEASANGGDLLRRVLARGGEGICAARWDSSFYETIWRCKRIETHDCIVTAKGSRQSIRLSENGIDRGWCPAFGGMADRLNVGDVVEVACQQIHSSGKFREPRLIRIRADKTTTA